MAIANALHRYLDGSGVSYELTSHERTNCAAETARAASIPADQLAKGVLLRHGGGGYLLAIVPASRQVRLEEVGGCLKEPVCLATETDVAKLFDDCVPGSVPPIGSAYGVKAIVDDCLEGLGDIYFEAGDHCLLVHLKGRDFDRLMAQVPHARISARHH